MDAARNPNPKYLLGSVQLGVHSVQADMSLRASGCVALAKGCVVQRRRNTWPALDLDLDRRPVYH